MAETKTKKTRTRKRKAEVKGPVAVEPLNKEPDDQLSAIGLSVFQKRYKVLVTTAPQEIRCRACRESRVIKHTVPWVRYKVLKEMKFIDTVSYKIEGGWVLSGPNVKIEES